MRGYPPELVEQSHAMQMWMNQGLHGRASRSRQAIVVDDVRTDPDYVGLIPDTRAELVIPIIRGDRVVGSLDLESPQVSAFHDVDLDFL